MKCERCAKHSAIIQIQQIVNNKRKSIRLCERCAKVLGIMGSETSDKSKFTIPNLFSDMFEGLAHVNPKNAKKCPSCDTTLETIIEEHKAGCTECYSAFNLQIEKELQKLFGNTRHIGKFPRRFLKFKQFLFNINDLKKQLVTAIKNEDYENAAILRDKIKEIKDSSW
jgi:protein arginine kinase activator